MNIPITFLQLVALLETSEPYLSPEIREELALTIYRCVANTSATAVIMTERIQRARAEREISGA